MNKLEKLVRVIFLGASIVALSGSWKTSQAHEVVNAAQIPQDFFVIQNSARDFFARGNENLEKEIEILYRDYLLTPEKLLMISEDLHFPETPQQFEAPEFLRQENL